MASKVKVVVVGAAGETGDSIISGLLAAPEQFQVTALGRESSFHKADYVEFKSRGVTVKAVDLDGPMENVRDLLIGSDVVISCLTVLSLEQEFALVRAAKEADVGRYVPSFFGPSIPPQGVFFGRKKKEEILGLVKRLYVPYTVLEVGWWFQLSFLPLPSRRIHVDTTIALTKVLGSGDTSMALTDNRDIGRYLARVVVDPRTLNKSVFAYGEMSTQNIVLGTLERLSGEKITRESLSREDIEKTMSDAKAAMAGENFDRGLVVQLGMAQYRNTLGIRGDNTPEKAKYLGYLDAKELYPDLVTGSFESYIQDALDGKVKATYDGRSRQ